MSQFSKRKTIGKALLTGVAAAWLAIAGGAGPAHAASAVVLYTADGLEDFYKAILVNFEKKTGSRVNIVTSGSGAVVNRLQTEKDSPKADVLVTLPPFVQTAVKDGLLESYKSSADSAIPASRKDPNGYWATFVDDYASFIYNPKLAKAPETFEDLLKPEYKGQVSYSNPITAGDGMAVVILLEKLWGEDKAFAYLAKLEQDVKFHTKGTGYLDTLVGRGEIKVANGDIQMDMDDKVHGGLAIEPTFLRPAPGQQPVTFSLPYAIALVKGGPNPAGGKALIDYLLSKEVQAKVTDVFGLPARDDVQPTGANAKAILAAVKDVKVVEVDWNHVLEKQKAWQERWRSEVIGASNKPIEVVKPNG
ncbi:MAG TPA: 2-aminoethylphosphonate ABC transporter substrate-binding protein [Alphaproteobacteria bacterium]|nr:2-aminoethylphosphonate ABC transporter substrate-binding protein [Alphaproteobacteria bacterium]